MRNFGLKMAGAGAAALMATMAASPAAAGTKDDIRDLQARMATVEQGMAGQSAQTVRIGELESQIQSLTGLIEELSYQLDIANRRLDAVSAALAGDALGADASAQGYLPNPAASGPVDLTGGDPIADQLRNDGASAAAPVPIPGAGSGADVALPLNPDAAYDYASTFLLRGDYQRAKTAFELYVEAFPRHSRTPDAQFRLGEIYLALGENASAADTFIEHIRGYPNDPRAAEAYLKLGTAFARLEKPEEACTVFKTMKTKYPDAGAAVTQRANLEMARISCQ